MGVVKEHGGFSTFLRSNAKRYYHLVIIFVASLFEPFNYSEFQLHRLLNPNCISGHK